MKCSILFFVFLLLFGKANAQESDSLELDKKAVRTVIETFFEGFHKQDSTIIKSTVAENVILQTTSRNQDGKTQFRSSEFSKFLASICSIPDSIKFKEKLTSFSIQVDRTMANAWVGYEFWLREEFSHCGINSFQLINFEGDWKIVYLIDTRGKSGCFEE
ncbi:nuclear transport factor 2 family protein [Flagellimonas sp. 389]|uniref:nuclear transport factor 2 family protein n=1 Tax=Flagellimonas sp. 389 TaxID=2835862 RepID=UPI001BD2E592|nr:nuclear transport factor 2 family protein [Flagellimonas sp. 389]MBS9463048.1 nuclear transport factor 2 family protein [Flagellimonas sp. 389]